ncbi:efflux RND transporter permease subunit [Myceligenerans xiligouense]|uniref:HAE1 family hydrophobic/amphiphilic exporter-1 n=1 Tax=Myceligenerans xiligouense TaxID=253184 RepID=A0A3N4Z1X4_9MICO|nr:efflux RND transporter permease subunit [Myceligenerans xiligouense]RPF20028.1 HAE1 family hydrophobic/amphiphilic exporter-1 [Myceligenerans xiligouense]
MFRLARLSLAHRAVVALTTVAVAVLGVMSMGQLKQELIPSLQLPMGIVVAPYPGSSPSVIEERVTEPVESAVQTIDGVESVTSDVSTGLSMTTVEFTYGTDIERVTQRLEASITRLGQALPEDVDPQVIAGSFDDLPVVQLAVAGDESNDALADTVETAIVPELEKLDDVRGVEVSGVREDRIVITPDDDKLADAGLTADQLSTLLRDNGVVMPGGTLTEGDRTWSVELGTSLDDIAELRALPLIPAAGSGQGAADAGAGAGATGGTPAGDGTAPAPGAADAGAAAAGAGAAADAEGATGGAIPQDPSSGTGLPAQTAPTAIEPVALGDVATVKREPVPVTSASRLDGEPSLGIAITKTPDGNTVEVSHAVQEALDDLSGTLDARDVTVGVVFDQAPFIEESIEGLSTEGGLGLLFAVLVILVFLASLRSTLVSAISIPLSLAATFIIMNITGYTLNILTLGALTISIGRVVDDAIVVIENIKRHLSYGEEKLPAILGAVREVGGAIAASTICTVAVFAPIALVGGMTGELFRPFALTVAIAMGASLIVALTIVPVLAYWFVKAPQVAGATDEEREAARDAAREAAEAKERRGLWQRAYVPTLGAALRRPVVSLLLAVAVLGGTLAMVPRLQVNFIGDSGQDTLTVTQDFEPGTSFDAQDDAARETEEVLAGVDGVETVQTTVGSGGAEQIAFMGGGGDSASYSITLDEESDGTAVADQVREAVEPLATGVTSEVTVATQDSGFGGSTVDLVVSALDSETLAEAAAEVEDAVTGVEDAAEVSNNLAAPQQIVQVDVDREKAAEAGLSESAVSGIVSAAMTPEQALGSVDIDERTLDVIVSTGEAPATRAELENLRIPTATGPVELTDLAEVVVEDVPTTLTRTDGERTATVAVTPAGQDLNVLTTALNERLADLDLPEGASVEVGGVATEQADAFNDLGLALIAAIFIVYVVMVATFGSLVQPLILLVSVPFAATGALGALLLSNTPLGVPALIGVLMLVGIVVSNAIVLIDLINQYRGRGMGLDEAVREGARQRLRPIVMTALATVFALTPMALGLTGGGAFIAQPLALVVIGGLVSSTLLTLLVVPVLYSLIERGKLRRADKRDARRRRRAAAEEIEAHREKAAADLAASATR